MGEDTPVHINQFKVIAKANGRVRNQDNVFRLKIGVDDSGMMKTLDREHENFRENLELLPSEFFPSVEAILQVHSTFNKLKALKKAEVSICLKKLDGATGSLP